MASRSRNSKGQFVKGGRAAAKTKTHTRTRTIVVRRTAAPVVHRAAPRRRHHKRGLLGGGVIGRLMPDATQIELGIAGGAIGWIAKGFAAKDTNSVAFKIGDAIPKLVDAGGFVGNVAVAAQGIAAVTNHPYARAMAKAATTIALYEYMKRIDGVAVKGDTVDGWVEYTDPPAIEGDPDDGGNEVVEGYIDPDDYGAAAG